MAILNKSSDLAALDVTVRTAFMDAYNASAAANWQAYATRQQSSSDGNLYPFSVDAAVVREWSEGERVINGLVLSTRKVVNAKYELTYGIKREALDDDASGAVRNLVSMLRAGGNKHANLPDKLCVSVITGNGTCLDGLTLFSASHKVAPNTASTATFSNTTSGALTAANFAAARAAMMALQAADGDPVNPNPALLIVPPALELTARQILEADNLVYTAGDGATTNVYKGRANVMVEPRLAAGFTGGSDSYWYLVDATSSEDRPVIFQEREGVEIVSLFNPSDPNVFERDEYVWGTRRRCVAAAGNPKKIFRRTG